MPLPSKKAVCFAATAIIGLGVAEAANLHAGNASILQNPGEGTLTPPPWFDGWQQEKREKQRKRQDDKVSSDKKSKKD